jgi:hypothetical protein
MPFLRPNKRIFVVSHILGRATVIAMLAFTATGVAQARPINYQHNHFRSGYAGAVYSSPTSVGRFGFVPGRGIVGESCELPTSACPNDERVTG